MRYISTRGQAPSHTFIEALLTGVADDGGLYVPETWPVYDLETIQSWVDLPYEKLMFHVIRPFIGGEIPDFALNAILHDSYKNFRHKDIAPIHTLNDTHHVLELFQGPTLAFKDFALQFLGQALDYVLEQKDKEIVVIGATSGDTGSAAIAGLAHCKRAKIFMMHPHDRISEVQRRQMTTVIQDNVHNLAVEGSFDDCQTMVKDLFRDEALNEKYHLVAVNSINWARLMAQVVYYVHTSLKLNGATKPLSFSVPTGNFGDIYAGYIAKKMGLPVGQLIVATNANDILHRFFHDNDYSTNAVHKTLSPSMDIQISSNFERLLFDLYDGDGSQINQIMSHFNSGTSITVDNEVYLRAKGNFNSCSVDDETTKDIIRETFAKYKYLVDPHTATGIKAADTCRKSPDEVMVTLSTAHPAKFPAVAEDVVGFTPELPEHMADIFKLNEKFDVIDNDISAIKSFVQKNA